MSLDEELDYDSYNLSRCVVHVFCTMFVAFIIIITSSVKGYLADIGHHRYNLASTPFELGSDG